MIIIILLIAFLINIWMENSSNEFYDRWIDPVLYFEVEFYIILFLGALIFELIKQRIQSKNAMITSLNKKLHDYELELKAETKSLWKSYADLNRFNQQETIQRIMATIVDSDENIIAVQLYDYVLKEGSKSTIIKVTHRDGFVAEGERLNALVQEHYEINNRIYKRFKRALRTMGKNNGISLLSFIENALKQIKIKSVEQLKGKTKESINYSLALLGTQSYVYYFTNERSYSSYTLDLLPDTEKESILNGNKRTGILRGILNHELVSGDNYIFYHNGNSDKKGRIYFTKGIMINGRKCVFLITLYKNMNDDEVLKNTNEISKRFMKLLSNGGISME